MRQLLFGEPCCPTEQHMYGDSVVAVVGRRGSEVRQLALRGRDRVLEIDHLPEGGERLQRAGVVGDCPVHVGMDAARCELLEGGAGGGVCVVGVRINEGDSRHSWDSTMTRLSRDAYMTGGRSVTDVEGPCDRQG